MVYTFYGFSRYRGIDDNIYLPVTGSKLIGLLGKNEIFQKRTIWVSINYLCCI